MPFVRRLARAEGEKLFDVVAGFVNSQVLVALVELRVLHLLHAGPARPRLLADLCGIPADRMQVLLQAGAGLGLLKRHGNGDFGLSLRGASLLGVPGLEAMILHHSALYADLANPVNLLRSDRPTELARFWPYVFGAAGAVDPVVTARYSDLMADSQVLVAEEVLALTDLSSERRLMDVGGGAGTFLAAVGARYPALALDLFDLPAVLAGTELRRVQSGLSGRVTLHPGSFRDDPLPRGASAISLIRVLYDHDDSTVARLLASAHDALPAGGRLIVAEPMSGGAKPDRITDVYFAIYTLAMQTGRTRSAADIGAALERAGFVNICYKTGFRSFVASLITAEKAKS